MTKRILAFGASTSSTSINKQFAHDTANRIAGVEVTELDLRGYTLPIYSADEEAANGVPADATRFLEAIQSHDGLVISLAEHNGSYAAAFKNLFDWGTRAEGKCWAEKPMLLLATSPGERGGATVLAAALDRFPRHDGNIAASFSLPSFNDNLGPDGVSDPDLAADLNEAMAAFEAALTAE